MEHLVQWFRDGGVLMWPLLACSLLAVAVSIERLVRLRRRALLDDEVVEDFQSLIEKGQAEKAVDRARNCPVLVGRILSRGLEEYLHTRADIETALVEAGERGLHVLHANMAVLNLVARVAPLLGLLGTVLGMI